MRAVRCSNKRIQLVDVPAPAGDGVRVRIVSAGVCGSDLHLVQSDFDLPFTLGHELAGELDDGRPVAIEPLSPCGDCEFCLRGDYNLCRLGPSMIYGTGRDGGMAEQVRVPERALVPLPPGVAARDACLVEPLAVAEHGLRLAGVRAGSEVAVVGGGSIGLCAVAAIAGRGAQVSLLARHEQQREVGARLGARVVDAANAGESAYDVVIDAAGTASALEEAVTLCRPGGILLLLATYWEGFQLTGPPGFQLCLKEVRVIPSSLYGASGGTRDIDRAALLLQRDPEIARALITHRYPLDAAREAFETAAQRSSGSIKVVLEP